MDTDNLITVIITTYNRRDLLPYAIRSVLKQSYTNFEIIIVNDFGEDVWDIVESFNSDKIKYLSHIKNSGPSSSKNTALNEAQGEIICYLDDDDLFCPNHLEAVIQVFERNSNINVVYTDAKYVNEIIKDSERIRVSEKNLFIGNKYSYSTLLINNYIPINSLAHRNKTLVEVGLFNGDMWSHEDWDFLIRLGKKYEFYYIDIVTVEVRNRINKDDNLLSEGNSCLYETYKYIYNKYPVQNKSVFKKRLALLFHLARNENKVRYYFLELVREPKQLLVFITLVLSKIKDMLVRKK